MVGAAVPGLTAVIHQTKMRLRQSSPATLCGYFKYSCARLYLMHQRPCFMALYVLCNIWGMVLWFDAFYVAAGGTYWRIVWKLVALRNFFHFLNVLQNAKFFSRYQFFIHVFFFLSIYWFTFFYIHFNIRMLTLCFSNMIFKHLLFWWNISLRIYIFFFFACSEWR